MEKALDLRESAMNLLELSEVLGNLGAFFTAILLCLSLICVGLQIRQNTNTTRAQIQQSRSEQSQAFVLQVAGSDEMLKTMLKIQFPRDFDPSRVDSLEPLEFLPLTIMQREKAKNG